tara:strand:- start:1229 stop:2353 length:1125 start_codon:yes stop_codon:yes gene_type:complete
MAIVINGSGTVTGLSVGGLPDGTVDAGTVAADVATQAELDAAGVGGANGVDFNDNVKARFGTGNDLEIFHDGSHSYIKDEGTGNLILRTAGAAIELGGDGEALATFTKDGSVELYHNNVKKLETIAAGIQVTGDLAIASDGKINISDGSYFIGGSNGYRFNSAADDLNCLIVRDNGNIHYGTSNDAPWNLTGNITPSAFWVKSSGQQWFAANDTFPLALNRCNGTGIIARFYKDGGITGDISTSSSGVSYNTSSDYRLKENVDYTWDATARLKQLKPARFNWIADDTNTLVDGFIAHEVESIVPEAVNGTKDAMQDEEYVITPAVEDSNGNITKEAVKGTRSVIDPQGIDQSKLVPLLVKTIQELEARITALEA